MENQKAAMKPVEKEGLLYPSLSEADGLVARSTDNADAVIRAQSFHVSCQSDRMQPNKNYVGILLFQYDGNDDWHLGGVHCKSGYIYVKESAKLESLHAREGQVHGNAYLALFKQELDDKVVGCGFSFLNGKFIFNSKTLNMRPDKYHDNEKTASVAEQVCILKALIQWHKTGVQNWSVDDSVTTLYTEADTGRTNLEKLKDEAEKILGESIKSN